MNPLHISIPGGRDTFEPGEEIELTLSWELDDAPDRIELRLVWNTAGKGTTDLGVAQRVSFELPSASDTQQTTVTLPSSPYSFSGQLISLIWAFEMIAFPSEDSTRQEITIAPAGKEVRLRAVETLEPIP